MRRCALNNSAPPSLCRPLELDFNIEIENAERCRELCRGFGDFVVIPQVHRALSSSRVLVMDFESGCRLNQMDQIKEQGIHPAK